MLRPQPGTPQVLSQCWLFYYLYIEERTEGAGGDFQVKTVNSDQSGSSPLHVLPATPAGSLRFSQDGLVSQYLRDSNNQSLRKPHPQDGFLCPNNQEALKIPLSARKPLELLFSTHIPIPTSLHQFPTLHLWALSCQRDPALPLMQDILLGLRSLFL